jgi:hypothetical protein
MFLDYYFDLIESFQVILAPRKLVIYSWAAAAFYRNKKKRLGGWWCVYRSCRKERERGGLLLKSCQSICCWLLKCRLGPARMHQLYCAYGRHMCVCVGCVYAAHL